MFTRLLPIPFPAWPITSASCSATATLLLIMQFPSPLVDSHLMKERWIPENPGKSMKRGCQLAREKSWKDDRRDRQKGGQRTRKREQLSAFRGAGKKRKGIQKETLAPYTRGEDLLFGGGPYQRSPKSLLKAFDSGCLPRERRPMQAEKIGKHKPHTYSWAETKQEVFWRGNLFVRLIPRKSHDLN